ncbi:MAG: PAS domain S-box protein [Cytophagales bacterium]|nr:PAS domain S-box protein [Bernardetiaceae bacterium]MDW8211095.1 PAS domain S-box protein [Cytophagales bacterium]
MRCSESALEVLFHNHKQGNVLLDNQMNVLAYNQLAQQFIQQLSGLDIKEGSSFLLYIASEVERENLIVNFRQALQGNEVEKDYDLTNLQGSTERIRAFHIPVPDSEGKIEQVCFSFVVLNQWLQAENQLKNLQNELASKEKFYQTLLENQPYANLVLSSEGKVLYSNQQAVHLLGKFDINVQKNSTDVFTHLRQSSLKELVHVAEQVFAESDPVFVEKEVTDVFERKYWIACQAKLLSINNSYGIHLQIRDITQQKKTEEMMRAQQERLRRSESQLKAVFDSSSDINIFVGMDFRLISFNRGAVEVFLNQQQKKLLTGLDIRTIIFENYKENFERSFQQALQGKSVIEEVEVGSSTGERQWYRFTYMLVTDHFQNKIGVIINAINITVHKRNEEKILQQNEQIKEFAFMTAHRLRAPLASVLGLIKVFELDKSITQEAVKELFTRLQTAAEELNYVVSEMNRTLAPLRTETAPQSENHFEIINYSAHPVSIVLIDDDPIVNMVSKTLLQRHYPGIIIHTFLKAEEALEFLKKAKKKPSLILLDIIMPGMNGWQFLEQFEQLPEKPPVFMLSSSLRRADQEEARRYPSVVDFITKPLDGQKIALIMRHLKLEK